MLKKVLLTILTLGFLAAVVYSYFTFRKIQQPISDALLAIPPNAAVIIEGNDLPATWKRLSDGNIMWEAWKVTEQFSLLDSEVARLHQLYTANPGLAQTMKDNPVYMAAAMSGAQSFHFLFVYSLPGTQTNESIMELFLGAKSQTATAKKNYDGAAIFELGASHGNFSFSIYKGLLIGSFSPILLEDAIRQLNSGDNLLQDPVFTRVQETAGTNNALNIFINHKIFPDLTGLFLSHEAQDQIKPLTNFSRWTELDLKIKSNYLMLNGFSVSPDSLNQYLSLFSDQKAQEIDATKVISARVATIFHFGFSNYKGFRKRYNEYLERTNQFFEYRKYVDQLNEKYETDIEEDLLSWLEYELVLYITEPTDTEFDQHTYALLRTRDPGAAKELLNQLSNKISDDEGDDPTLIVYMDHEMRRLNLPNLFKNMFGPLFGKIRGNYYTFIDRYVLFANTPAALRDAIVDFENQRTLQKDLNFVEFSENLSEESNLFVYSNIARSPLIYQAYTSGETSADINAQLDLFRQFEAVGFQITTDHGGMYYNNIFLKHNPIYKQETKSLWERQLDSLLWSKPQLVTNHYTNMKEVLVQDQSNMLYLITNTGKLLWQKQLDAPIIGEVSQVDAFANKKLQLLFNTKSKLYLIDRNGAFLEGFPVDLSSPASAPHTAMDYDNNSKYRILIPGEGGVIMNYDKTGKPVDGWKFEKAGASILQPIQLLTQDKKDYVVAIDSLGGVYVLNRKGKNRLTIRERLPLASRSRFFIEGGNSLNQTYLVGTDQGGNVVKINFEDELENISLTECREGHFFQYADLNNDGSKEYILADSNKLMVFGNDKNLLFEQQFEANVSHPIQVFYHPDGNKEIGVVTASSSEIFLMSSEGILREKFPLYGSTGIAVGDIDQDGSLNLVTGHTDKSIYTYSLDH